MSAVEAEATGAACADAFVAAVASEGAGAAEMLADGVGSVLVVVPRAHAVPTPTQRSKESTLTGRGVMEAPDSTRIRQVRKRPRLVSGRTPGAARTSGPREATRLSSSLRMKPPLSQTLGAILFAFVAACAPPPKPAAVPTKVDEPPPPPKCESFDEGCIGKSETRARLPKLGWSLVPPAGWEYAQQDDVTIARKGRVAGSILVGTTFEAPKALWELKKARLDALEQLSKRVGIQLAQKNVIDFHVRGVDDKLSVGDQQLSIWEQEGAKRDRAVGNVVLVVGTLEGREVLLLGFVPKDSEADSGPLVESLQSLAKNAEGKRK